METATITLAHGAGGRASDELIRSVVLPALGGASDMTLCDAALISNPGERIAFTTDGFTVTPLFFPGGNIGRLAVFGTVNDLAMVGAVPRYLALSIIAEEGLPMESLRSVLREVGNAAREASVRIVTGDTKVVGSGAVDKLFLTTAGIGTVGGDVPLLSPDQACPGDVVLVSGTMGDHGVAVLSAREGLSFTPQITSDCAPLAHLAGVLLAAAPSLRCMRDPTRGGLASVLNEFARAADAGFEIQEDAVPVRREVAALSEILGLDPLYLANEGKLVAVVGPRDADRALSALRAHPLGLEARAIGTVNADHRGLVVMRTGIGTRRIVEYPTGELLPRIC
ncbi:MAG: hydrogenase expression/formation protein HypE [Candidatus Eisenbacteria bacterium]|jgi:hydrogenase expression/formation protein HypE|nr:hydrogenase expression/formation protein HypE [Candidatus Eisenbacteria bacterium]